MKLAANVSATAETVLAVREMLSNELMTGESPIKASAARPRKCTPERQAQERRDCVFVSVRAVHRDLAGQSGLHAEEG